MKKSSLLFRIYDLYHDGFQKMTVGRTLWIVVIVKLFIIFAVLKIFFFPDFLQSKAADDADKAAYVSTQIVGRVVK
jgi:hypothetical protein